MPVDPADVKKFFDRKGFMIEIIDISVFETTSFKGSIILDDT